MDLKTWRRARENLRYREALAHEEDPEAVRAQEARVAAILRLNNTTCPKCGGEIHEAVACPMYEANIHEAHCHDCQHYMQGTPGNNPKCRYRKSPGC